MNNFESIIASIEEELKELRKINRNLYQENIGLKNRLALFTGSEYAFVSVDDAFASISSKYNGKSIGRAYNAVKNHGYENICDLQGVKFYEWKGVGDDTATVIALVLEHYGIRPAIPISGGGYRNNYEFAKDSYYFK